MSLKLEELPSRIHLLSFFADDSNSRLVKEKELSVKAGEVVGNLYKAFEGQYRNLDTDPKEQRSLNVLIVRMVFLLYAEDAGLLQSHQAFGNYLKDVPAGKLRGALKSLFEVLDTRVEDRDPYLEPELAAFPYVNGGLFADEDVVIPQFTEDMKLDLVLNASISFDWKDISPTIFGAVFESTLNPETRRAGGMHYTSIENIHKVIDPLFLDDLREELAGIEAIKTEKNRRGGFAGSNRSSRRSISSIPRAAAATSSPKATPPCASWKTVSSVTCTATLPVRSALGSRAKPTLSRFPSTSSTASRSTTSR